MSVSDRITVSDAGSSNGSKVDAVQLNGDEKRTVRSGATVAFGRCAFCLLSTAELTKLLRTQRG